jgi:hypothetical protein
VPVPCIQVCRVSGLTYVVTNLATNLAGERSSLEPHTLNISSRMALHDGAA